MLTACRTCSTRRAAWPVSQVAQATCATLRVQPRVVMSMPKLAQDMYFYRIKKYIGAYAAAMGGLDVIVFTAGVGENQVSMRSEVCKGLEFLGVKFDESKNNVRGEEAIISADDSKVKVVVIPTDEELMIATDTMNLL